MKLHDSISVALLLAFLTAGVAGYQLEPWNYMRTLAALMFANFTVGLLFLYASRHIIWTHGGYVWLTILAFGLVSVFFPEHLVSNHPLGIALSGFIAIFWGIRLFIQFFGFDASPHRTNYWLKLGFHGLTLTFAYFTLVYGGAA